MHIYLKIKAKELSAEAKFNKQEQRKCLKKARKAEAKGLSRTADFRRRQAWGMKDHLEKVVKRHVRCTQIARAFLSGHEYKDVERWTYRPLSVSDWEYVKEMVLEYGDRNNPRQNRPIDARYSDWQDRAFAHVARWQLLDEAERKLIIREVCPLKPKKPFDKKAVA